MKLLTFFLVIVGLLFQHVFAEGQSAVMGVSEATASPTHSSDWYLERNCRRRVALAVREFTKEQLSQTPRPVGYLVSSVGINRWVQSLKLVPDMIPSNAELIEKHSPTVATLLKNLGSGEAARGLSKLVEKVGVVGVDGMTADKSLEGFFALGGDHAQNSYEVCLVRSFSLTPLGKEACTTYGSTGEAGLKLLAIKLFTNSMRKSPLGQFAIRYGGLHGLAKKDAKFITRLSQIVSHTRFGALVSRVGGFPKLLEKITSGAHGLEAVAWNLLGPKLWEKVSQCHGGTGLELANKKAWKNLVTLNKNTVYIPSFPSSSHYTFQFWIKPRATIPEWGSILHHGNSETERSPAVWTCRNSFGLHIRQDTTKGTEGIECSAPLPVDQCTLVTVMNRDGELRLYYNDNLVQKAIIAPSKSVTAPVYFSNPWAAPANAAVMPVSALTRAITEAELERSIARTYSVCSDSFPRELLSRFSAIAQDERLAVHEMRFKQVHSETSLIDQHAQVSEAATSSVDAFLVTAQRETCLFRLHDLAVTKFVSAVKESPLSSVFSKYNNDLRSFLDAGIKGEIDIADLQKKVEGTKLGSTLSIVGGLPAIIGAYKVVDTSSTPGALTQTQLVADAWSRVQGIVFKMGGGKLEHALDRCVEQVHLNLNPFDVDKAITTEACNIVNNWGRTALPGYGIQLFERALAKSRVGHLYKHYGSITTLAAALRSNPALESKVGALLYQTEFGTLLAKATGAKKATVAEVQKGFSALLSAAMQGPGKLLASVNDIVGPKVQTATKSCPETSAVQQVRSRCRQRTVRRAVQDLYNQLDRSPLKPHLVAAYTASPLSQLGGVYTPSVGLEALARMSASQLNEIEKSIADTNVSKLIMPVGGLPALVGATRAHSEMQQLVWRLFKVQLLPDVDKCVATIAARTAHETAFVEQCRTRVRDFYNKRFNDELAASMLGKFVTKFGGIGGIARHSSELLTRLSSLVERASASQPIIMSVDKKPVPSLASRIQRVGGLVVVLETVRRDSTGATLNNLVLDMYGASAQAALDHCEAHAGAAAVASTTNFLSHLRGKLSDPAFKRILDRFLLNAHRPFVKNVVGQELDALRGINGVIAASADGKDADLNAYVQARLGGVNIAQTALYPWFKSVGMAAGLRSLGRERGANLAAAINSLKCLIVDKTWINKVFTDMGGCDSVMQKINAPQTNAQHDSKVMSLVALDELAQSTLRRPFAESGLNGLLGHNNKFDESILRGDGSIENVIRSSMLEAFATEHGEGHTAAMRDMVSKILSKMDAKKKETEHSLLESASVDASEITAQPVEEKVELPPSATMPDVTPHTPKVINNAPEHCPNQCSGRGKCVQNTAKKLPSPSGETFIHPYECICDLGWTGTGCEILIDEFVRFLMSRGAYAMPQCCNVCRSQAHANVDGRFVPAAAAFPPEVDPLCSTPDWISNPSLRSKCVKQILQARSRFLPTSDLKATQGSVFLEMETTFSPFGVALDNSAPTAALAEVEKMFDTHMAPAIPAPASSPSSFVASSTKRVYPNSASAMFPKKTAAQIAAEKEKAMQDAFAAAHGTVASTGSASNVRLGSFMSLATATGLHEEPPHSAKATVTTTGRKVEASAMPNVNDLTFDTSFLHEPQDLSKIKVEPCCVPCDLYPDPIAPKMPLEPKKELSITEQLKTKDSTPKLALPHDKSIAENMAIAKILAKRGLPVDNKLKRRGPLARPGSFVSQMADPNYVRKSLRGPLPSELVEQSKKDSEGCCNYCPYKKVKGLPWKKEKQGVTPAFFLEEDSVLLESADEGLVSFLEESMEVLNGSEMAIDVELGHDADADIDSEVHMDVDELHEHDTAASLNNLLAGADAAHDMSFADIGADQESMLAAEMAMENDIDADEAANEFDDHFRLAMDVRATGDVKRDLKMWWSKLQRGVNQTMPMLPDLTNVDLRVFKDPNTNAPFLPKPPVKTPACCNVCPSVFTLRQTPHDPWQAEGPAFELID